MPYIIEDIFKELIALINNSETIDLKAIKDSSNKLYTYLKINQQFDSKTLNIINYHIEKLERRITTKIFKEYTKISPNLLLQLGIRIQQSNPNQQLEESILDNIRLHLIPIYNLKVKETNDIINIINNNIKKYNKSNLKVELHRIEKILDFPNIPKVTLSPKNPTIQSASRSSSRSATRSASK